MPEATERVAAQEPRHRRRDAGSEAGVDPFEMPDPVEEKLRRWRAEREEPSADHNGHSPTPDDPADAAEPVPSETESPSPYAEPGWNGDAPRFEDAPYDRQARQSSAITIPEWQTSERGPVAADFEGPAAPDSSVSDSAVTESMAVVAGADRAAESDAPGRTAPFAAGGAAPAIEVRSLHKRFKDTVAVEDVSFTVQPGSIVAILGPNGAGKTTTVNMLCTLLKPDGGSATVHGHDVVSEAPAVRKSIMLTGQFAALDESLTGRENLILFGRLLGLSKSAARARADELLDTFSLLDAGAKKVGKYSGGMRRRIDIACGLVTAPKVVFLDEPTTGLDPRSRQEVWSLVEKLRSSGVTILLTTQYLEEADTLADNIVVIDKGRVVAEGTSDELKDSIGAAYCEVTPQLTADLPRLREVLADLIPAGAVSDEYDHMVAVPAPRGPETLVDVIQRTAAAGIPLSDIALRRPSLDEVFLALTDPRRDRRPTT
ncbi:MULTISPECIES: ATP-binding cassette domain-containing protein [Gordonia]|uniref:ATP-binding cassette domain-containing protein n=1 Tax=Gordonia amicalis TaxID=89053 RepID=A0AAE4R2P4_9ACTN|nr:MULTISPECIES: ATP-binding cassette domain-containing protein [Gordonia]KAF0970240.1 Vitamin B12 import ATP-binding protein BtuD [Gordonia sp. YY1]MCZ4650694.1 ATP-binding cassette domain-containing protein [Gordonia amicalis]MDJ0451707.1 ATP-binding cassette domain-containing protein [Gordonia amicalis]MDV6306557.1 ATP-binding cassette domain-containing protein [Gordonia amicalis]MDV6311286.1 ATP-binding cassette domain-containing protein [Gordonia amicalis]